MATLKITMKHGGGFNGAKSGKHFSYAPGAVLTIDEQEITHLDKDDYTVGEVKAEEPKSKKK